MKLYLIFLPLLFFASFKSFSSNHNIHLNASYSKNTEVWSSVDPATPQVVGNSLKIGRNQEGKVAFSFWLNQDNGHVCRLSAVSKVINESYLMYSEYIEWNKTTCVLKIYETDNSIVIYDVNGECSKNYCGARASIGKTTFPLSSRKELKTPVDINSW